MTTIRLASCPLSFIQVPVPAAHSRIRVAEIHPTARRVAQDAVLIAAAADEVERMIRAAYGIGNGSGRTLTPLEQVYKFNQVMQLLHTMADLQKRRQEIRHGAVHNTATMASNLWQNICNNHDFVKDPLRITHRTQYYRLHGHANALLTMCQGDPVQVEFPPPAQHGLVVSRSRRRAPLGAREEHFEHGPGSPWSVNLDEHVTAMTMAAPERDQARAFEVLCDAAGKALEVCRRSPKALMAVTIARETFPPVASRGAQRPGDGPMWTAVSALRRFGGHGRTLAKVTQTMLRLDVEWEVLRWAREGGSRFERAQAVLNLFHDYGGLEPEAQQQLRDIFEELDAHARAGEPAQLSGAQTRVIRTQLRTVFDGPGYAGALALLSWLGFMTSVRDFVTARSTGETLRAWGAVLPAAHGAYTATVTFMDRVRDANVARSAIQTQAAAASSIWTTANAASALSSLLTIVQGVQALDEAYDQHNDFQVTIEGVRILGGVVSLIAIAVPGLQPVVVVVGLTVVALEQFRDLSQRAQPVPLRHFKRLCTMALELRGPAEPSGDDDTLAGRLGVRRDLYELMNSVCDHEETIFWRPLMLDDRLGVVHADAGQPGTALFRLGLEAGTKLRRLHAFLEGGASHAASVLYGTPFPETLPRPRS